MRLESGDLLAFGGPSRMCFHGVAKCHEVPFHSLPTAPCCCNACCFAFVASCSSSLLCRCNDLDSHTMVQCCQSFSRLCGALQGTAPGWLHLAPGRLNFTLRNATDGRDLI